MKNVIVIYRSRYGYTKQYAKWIAGALDCPLAEQRQITVPDLAAYDTVIYGGGLYAGGVSGISLITKNYRLLQNKNIVLFTCGLADPENPENRASVRESLSKVLTPEMQEHITVFHLRGGIDYARLSIIHKIMMAMLHRVITRKASPAALRENQEFLETYGKKADFTDKGSVAPIVEYVSSLM